MRGLGRIEIDHRDLPEALLSDLRNPTRLDLAEVDIHVDVPAEEECTDIPMASCGRCIGIQVLGNAGELRVERDSGKKRTKKLFDKVVRELQVAKARRGRAFRFCPHVVDGPGHYRSSPLQQAGLIDDGAHRCSNRVEQIDRATKWIAQ